MLAPGKNISQKSVLLIAPQPFFVNRGTPINVRAMAESLSSLGYAVDLLVFPVGQDLQIPGVSILRSPRIPGIRSVPIGPSWRKVFLDILLSLSALLRCIRKRYDVIHGVEEAGIIAWVLSRMFRTPYVFDMDSCMVSQLESSGFMRAGLALRGIAALERHCIEQASAVTTVCTALSEKVREFAPEAVIHQIEDFPIEGLQETPPESIANIRQQWQLDGKKVVLYTGNFEGYQGVELLIDGFHAACSRLAGTASTRLLLVGGDEEKIRLMKERAHGLGLEDTVIFTGPQPAELMGAFMAAADVLVSPRTQGNNTPLKLYSYMASGRAIVATNIASHTQVIDAECAYLCAPTAPELGAALIEALSDTPEAKERRSRLIARSQELIRTRYNRSVFTQKLEILYGELIGTALEVPSR